MESKKPNSEMKFYENLRKEEDKKLANMTEEERIEYLQKTENDAFELAKSLGIKVLKVKNNQEEV